MRLKLIAPALLPLAWCSVALAQTTQNADTDKPAEAAKSAPAPTRQAFGNWTLICATPPGATEPVCEADIALQPEGQLPPVARLAFLRGAGDKPLRLVAIVQANLTLAPGVEVISDPEAAPVVLAFKSCLNSACLADADLSDEQTKMFRAPTHTGQLTIRNAAGEKISAPVPAKGLEQALNALLAAPGK